MEVIKNLSLRDRIGKWFLKEPLPLTKKRDVDWSGIKKFGAIGVGIAVLILLFLPTPKEEQTTFHERTEPGSTNPQPVTDPSEDTLAQLQQSRTGYVPGSLDHLYRPPNSLSASGTAQKDRNTSMVIGRPGFDSKTQLPPGARIPIRLLDRLVVSTQAMPVIGVVSKDVVHEDGLAIPQGSKILGEIAFDDASERAQVSWRTLQFPDGRERPFSAIGVDRDGQVGVEGKVRSDGMKNAIGQTVTRFIGAYAEGSMERGQLGSAPGGHENGLKNAVAETAKDQASSWGEDMKKQKKWIELNAGQETLAVLNQSFSFRDPGAIGGR